MIEDISADYVTCTYICVTNAMSDIIIVLFPHSVINSCDRSVLLLCTYLGKLTPFPEQKSPLEPTGQVWMVSCEGSTHCLSRQARVSLVPHALPSDTNPTPKASASALK